MDVETEIFIGNFRMVDLLLKIDCFYILDTSRNALD
jgi:hypothetical protein